jgi:hypothetical protein
MRVLGVVIDDELYSPQGHRLSPSRAPAIVEPEPPRAVRHLDPIDEFNAHLAQAIRVAQAMTEHDKRRASEFMEAARGMLTAVTRLKPDEQRRFEQALRNAK